MSKVHDSYMYVQTHLVILPVNNQSHKPAIPVSRCPQILALLIRSIDNHLHPPTQPLNTKSNTRRPTPTSTSNPTKDLSKRKRILALTAGTLSAQLVDSGILPIDRALRILDMLLEDEGLRQQVLDAEGKEGKLEGLMERVREEIGRRVRGEVKRLEQVGS